MKRGGEGRGVLDFLTYHGGRGEEGGGKEKGGRENRATETVAVGYSHFFSFFRGKREGRKGGGRGGGRAFILFIKGREERRGGEKRRGEEKGNYAKKE